MICPKCNGTGESQSYNPCSKCWGDGEIDWIENVVGKKLKSGMDINTTLLIKKLQKDTEQILTEFVFEPFDDLKTETISNCVDDILKNYKNKQTLYNYKIDIDRLATQRQMDIHFKPIRSIENIILHFKLQ